MGQVVGLVMLLPHGYGGAGAEHSRDGSNAILQLCADYNIQVHPFTPAQIFSFATPSDLRPYRKPLIVFTPKSCYAARIASHWQSLTDGHFQPIIAEAEQLD